MASPSNSPWYLTTRRKFWEKEIVEGEEFFDEAVLSMRADVMTSVYEERYDIFAN
ncbi:hypothetical protein ACTXT7_014662 [Hymenolepis weldensis]